MKLVRVIGSIVLAAGLAACASSPDYGLRYQDGSYYSPAAEGRGDYYIGPDYRPDYYGYYGYDEFDRFFGGSYYDRWYGGWYGSPWYGGGGYCSVRYRYCSSRDWVWGGGFPSTGFQIYFGSPWDPYWGHYSPAPRPYRPRHPAPTRPSDDPRNDQVEQDRPWTPPSRTDARRPRPRPDPMDQDSDSPFPAPGSDSDSRRRSTAPPRRESVPTRTRSSDRQDSDDN